MERRAERQKGFTLIELLVSITIVGVLVSVSVGVFREAMSKGKATAELAVAHQVMVAYLNIAQSNNGVLIPGYASLPAIDNQGRNLQPPVSSRYPWRLAPALDYNMGLLYNSRSSQRLKIYEETNAADYPYLVSFAPALGINSVFVGGDQQILNPSPKATQAFGDFCVTRADLASNPAELIAFASACFDDNGARIPGYFRVEAPKLTGTKWQARKWKKDSSSETYGNVDFRYNGKTVAGMLDGRATLLSFDEANDMRMWSDLARIADDPEHALSQ